MNLTPCWRPPRNSSGMPTQVSDSRIRQWNSTLVIDRYFNLPWRRDLAYPTFWVVTPIKTVDFILSPRPWQDMSSIINSLIIWCRDKVLSLDYMSLKIISSSRASTLALNTHFSFFFFFPFGLDAFLWGNICSYSSKKEIISASQKSISLAQSALAFVDVSTLSADSYSHNVLWRL